MQGRALPAELINPREALEGASVAERLGDKGDTPPLARLAQLRSDRMRGLAPLPAALPSHSQALLTVQPLDSHSVDRPAFPSEEDVDAEIAPPRPLSSRPDPRSQRLLRLATILVAHPAGPPNRASLTDVHRGLDLPDDPARLLSCHDLFPRRSSRT